MKRLLSLSLLGSALYLAGLTPQPNPEAPFAGGKIRRGTAELKVSGFHYGYRDKQNKAVRGSAEQPSFLLGNKEIAIRKVNGRAALGRENSIQGYIDGKRAFAISWAGVVPGMKKGGYPFFTGDLKDRLLIDKTKKTICYERPYLLDETGKQAVFSYRIHAEKESRIVIDWDLGITQKEMDVRKEKFYPMPWLYFFYQTPDDVFQFANLRHLPGNPEELVKKKYVKGEVKGPLIVRNGKKDGGYSISGTLKGRIEERAERLADGSIRHDGFIWMTGSKKFPVKGQFVIDLGLVRFSGNTLPPVGGIDFWKQDATHIPLSPVRNLWPNPSFEQGLRYWRWIGGGATYTPVKDGTPRDRIVSPGLFGKHALFQDAKGAGGSGMVSLPVSLRKGKKYVFSFYAKAAGNRDRENINLHFISAALSGQFSIKGVYGVKTLHHATRDWQRFSRSFTADYGGLRVLIHGSNVLFDGFQLEEGEKPTEFIAPPVEGMLLSDDPENYLSKEKDPGLKFRLSGKTGTRGKVILSISNAFRETLWEKTYDFQLKSGEELLLPDWKPHSSDEGIYRLKAEFRVNGKTYFDYYRFSFFKPLQNRHATKNIPGTLMHLARITRGDMLGRRMMEWGFGSTSWGVNYRAPGHTENQTRIEKKYRIDNFGMTTDDKWGWTPRSNPLNPFHWKEISPALEKEIEEEAFRKVRHYDMNHYKVFTFSNEEEGTWLVRQEKYHEWAKGQIAAAKGIKRANPKLQTMPTMGTSGYNRMRGQKQIDGYLAAAKKAGWKYDAIAVHTYGSIDKGTFSYSDLDEDLALLISRMKFYGYGPETPIYITETGNTSETNIKEWNTTSYDAYQSGKAGYDFGLREFNHAASFLRMWIICLKYWPQVQATNIWCTHPYIDQYFTPILTCKAANTLGIHFPDVKYRADVKPSGRIRGYVFDLPDGSAAAAVWCIDHDVENGLRKGPEVKVHFSQKVRVFDFMGTERIPGNTLNLTQAPLIIKAADGGKLASALQNMEISNKQDALSVSFQPAADGGIEAKIQNLTGKRQTCILSVDGKNVAFDVDAVKTRSFPVPESDAGNAFGKMFRWNHAWNIPGFTGGIWKMDYFYVPYVPGTPDWNKIPAIPVTNRHIVRGVIRDKFGRPVRNAKGDVTWITPKAGYPGDFEANFRMAWNNENLYLRVEVTDDKFVSFPEHWENKYFAPTQLYALDGCLEVYFDCGANGRTNASKTYDTDDYRYDFSVGKSGKSGPGMIYRFREVDHQLADGTNMPKKEEAAKKILCDFQFTQKGYTYTIVFGQRYLEPFYLKPGTIAGFALYLHDKDEKRPAGHKALTLATEPGSHCDYKPHVWPLMILAK